MPSSFVSFRPLRTPVAMAVLLMVLVGCSSWTPTQPHVAIVVGLAVVAGALVASQSHHDQTSPAPTVGIQSSPGRPLMPQMLACANNVACGATSVH